MAFSLDSALLWLHFGKFWNGELKPFLAHELRPDEKLLLDRFHDEVLRCTAPLIWFCHLLCTQRGRLKPVSESCARGNCRLKKAGPMTWRSTVRWSPYTGRRARHKACNGAAFRRIKSPPPQGDLRQ